MYACLKKHAKQLCDKGHFLMDWPKYIISREEGVGVQIGLNRVELGYK